jgi:hypothetical protein
MGLISRTADLYYTYRFLKLLVTKWEDTDAFKLGIIDKDGNILKRASQLNTGEEKSAYTTFHRLVFNIKRLLQKLPAGRTRIASYLAALYLIKEHTGMSDDGIREVMENIDGVQVSTVITENTWFLNPNGQLNPGSYTLLQDAPIIHTSEFRAKAGTKIDVKESVTPMGLILGVPVFGVRHRETGQFVCITTEDISR